MSKSLLTKLQQAADNALKSPNIEEGMKHLAHAFSLFSRETANLEEAYSRLQERFKNIHIELEKTNVQLTHKIKELNTISIYLNNILKNISQGIIFIDIDGIITTYNPVAEEILEIDRDKVIFQRFWNNFTDDFFGFSIKTSLNFKLSQKLNYICLNKSKKELEVCSTFITQTPKAYQGLIILLRDITQIQQLQQIAHRHERLKELGEMAAAVVHEIKNPLGGIRGYASLLFRDLEGSKHLQEMASFIIEGTKNLERLVNKVLHFSRPIEIKPYPQDMGRLIKGICKLIKIDPSFPDNINMQLHLPKDALFVPIDKELIKSVLLNLLVNAIQAIEKKGVITISLIKNNDLGVITISDTGKGIEEKDLENIFSPFFTTKQTGNGLGLSETYKIIRAHFGNIDVRSQPNFGTTFTITLPLKR